MFRRVLGRLLTLVSLLLCAATTVAWLRGYSVADSVRWYRNDQEQDELQSARGWIVLHSHLLSGQSGFYYSQRLSYLPREPYGPTSLREGGRETDRTWAGIGFRRYENSDQWGSYRVSVAFVPCWLLALAASMLPVRGIAARVRQRRKQGVGFGVVGQSDVTASHHPEVSRR